MSSWKRWNQINNATGIKHFCKSIFNQILLANDEGYISYEKQAFGIQTSKRVFFWAFLLVCRISFWIRAFLLAKQAFGIRISKRVLFWAFLLVCRMPFWIRAFFLSTESECFRRVLKPIQFFSYGVHSCSSKDCSH